MGIDFGVSACAIEVSGVSHAEPIPTQESAVSKKPPASGAQTIQPKTTRKKMGRPLKGFPEPFDMTAEQVAKAMFALTDRKRRDT